MSSNSATPGDNEMAVSDLGPLAWVLEELRKSLDGAVKALRRFVRDAELARGSNLGELDASHLRIARQQLHQAVGALEMVGLGVPAKMLRAMESLTQKFVQRPELCSEDAANKVERASFALTEYLEGVLKGKQANSVALFPQYRAVLDLVGGDAQAHPADLWQVEWRWHDVPALEDAAKIDFSPALRAQMDQAVLRVMRGGDSPAAQRMAALCAGLAVNQSQPEGRAFWMIGSAFFEGIANSLFPEDVYTKRAASRVLRQYASMARGDNAVSDRLAQDLAFFCSLAQVSDEKAMPPALERVRTIYRLARGKPIQYEVEQFGRFDPALMTLARKRIAAAAETWSALAGGDVNRLKNVAEQFAAVAESIVKLHPESAALGRALNRAIDGTVRSGGAPVAPVAMEVATSILYLEAAYEDLDPTDSHLAERSARLAQRLEHVGAGGEPEPLESWMEDLYRRVSDRQTMGSVVDELRTTLGGVEKALDQFFRAPQDKSPLHELPSQLAQMRGVFSVLGLDQASLAALRMRDSVEKFMVDDIDEESARRGVFEKLGNSLGAMGFLIDMLSYQRALAKKLFVYDEELGEFKPLMGRERTEEPEAPVADAMLATQPMQAVPEQAPPAPDVVLEFELPAEPVANVAGEVASPIATVEPAQIVADASDEEDELIDIFLDEAREVVTNGLEAARALAAEPSNLAEQTTLRRAFHTLKGSSRMVGLTEFGEAAWAYEQLLNTWLADQRPASDDLIQAATAAMQAFGQWVEDIAGQTGVVWNASAFRKTADAMRLQGQLLPLPTPHQVAGVQEGDHQVVQASDQADESQSLQQVQEPFEAAPLFDEAGTQAVAVPDSEGDAPSSGFAATQVTDSILPEMDGQRADFAATQTFGFEPTQPLLDTAAPVSEGTTVSELDFGEFDFASAATQQPVDGSSRTADSVEIRTAPETELVEVGTDLVSHAPGSVEEELSSGELTSEPLPLPVTPVATSDEQDLVAHVDESILITSEPSEAAAEQQTLSVVPEATGESEPSPVLVVAPALPEDASGDALHAATPEIELNDADEPGSAESVDQIKVIGDLRLSIPLYNVYLNEADEWSRRLQLEVSEWALELQRPLPDSLVSLAHSLAGSSATVGFSALSEMARLMEHALQHIQLHHQGTAEQAKVFTRAAEDIRRLLHQFAAGFLKTADAHLLTELQGIIESEFPAPSMDSMEAALDDEVVPEQDIADEEAGVLSAAMPLDVAPEVSAPPEPLAIPDEPSAAVAMAVAPAPLTVMDAQDEDELDAIDQIDRDLFPIFEEEAVELLPQLGSALRQWVARPENMGARSEVLRVLHTLKGSARLAGAMRLGEMAHRMESGIEQLGSEQLLAVQLEPLLGRFDALQNAFYALGKAEGVDEVVETTVASALQTTETHDVAEDAGVGLSESSTAPLTSETPVVKTPLRVLPRATVAAPTRGGAHHTVRVRSQLLDRLVNQAGEVMISRARLEARLTQLRGSLTDLSGNLERLRHQLRDVELQSESQMQSRLAQAKDSAQAFDPLEFDRFTRVQELTRMMAESVHDVATVQRNLQRSIEGAEDDLIAQGRQARELQRDLLRTRMVEFDSVSERLYGVVRQAGKDTGKQVKLDIIGGAIEMDRGVLERMAPAFEHLLRNSVGHGIESASTRQAAGKSPNGTITVQIVQNANDIAVSFSDDGSGLNLERIAQRARSLGLVAPDAQLSEPDAANLIFQPGFSTAEHVTELSGRGIGMDVVRAEVTALGGRIETSTQAGNGTTFRLILPLTTAVTQVVMLRMGDFTIGVPSSLVETVLRTPAAVLEQAYRTGNFEFGGESLPFYWAGALLQVSGHSQEPPTKTRSVVVFRSAGQRLAVHVDEILGNREVVVKNLGPQLAQLPGLAGISVLASGAVALIYNPVALANVYADQAKSLSGGRGASDSAVAEPVAPILASQAENAVPLVLVVDDSITVRRVTQRLLKREGYRVALASDGLDALERLQEETPTVVLSDIEMPRMDGFDLARNIRADGRWRDLPIIMITSRIAVKHREHAKELGVDHYLGKPYSEDELLGLVRSYCAKPVEA